MNAESLKEYWKKEEEKAKMIGWDFEYIADRFHSQEETLPWELNEVIGRYRKNSHRLLDIDTGGGEFLLSLGHPYELTCATEGYAPNVELCRERFGKHGIEFLEMKDYANMPFENERFDIIINRHGAFEPKEIRRALRPNGVFITQQVGENNDRELVEMLLPDVKKSFSGHDLANCVNALQSAGMTVLEQDEAYRPISFYDTGALVWFAKIIEWEFVGFSVESCFERLLDVENEIRKNGSVSGKIHRFYIVAQKQLLAE